MHAQLDVDSISSPYRPLPESRPNLLQIPQQTVSSIPPIFTASKGNTGVNTLQNSPHRKQTQESKVIETQADDFDDANELSGVSMNPLVRNDLKQDRERALKRNSRLLQPGSSLFGFENRRNVSKTLSLDRNTTFKVHPK